MRRRDIFGVLGGVAAWPLSTHAQQAERLRRIGVLTNLAENDQEGGKRMKGFLDALQKLGWRDGDNIRIDYRYTGKVEVARRYAAELVALAPDVILATGSSSTGPLLEVTRTVPIVRCTRRLMTHRCHVGSGFVPRNLTFPPFRRSEFPVLMSSLEPRGTADETAGIYHAD